MHEQYRDQRIVRFKVFDLSAMDPFYVTESRVYLIYMALNQSIWCVVVVLYYYLHLNKAILLTWFHDDEENF